MNKINQHKLLFGLGVLAWLLIAFFKMPDTPKSQDWVEIILLLAPLFLVPLGVKNAFPKTYFSPQKHLLLLLAALAFSASYFLEKGLIAGLLVIPYLAATIALFFQVYLSKENTPNRIYSWCFLAAFLFLPIAPMWALADRMNWQPMGFTPIIVLLTAVHFHYAGFALTLATAFALKNTSNLIPKLLAWGVILGVPAVAIGITSTQLNLPAFVEIIAVTLTAGSAFGIGVWYVFKGFKIGMKQLSGVLFMIGGIALTLGMSLAMLYGWRTVFPHSFLSIPWMYAVHGTLNSLGFALPILLGWALIKNQ